MADLDLSCWRIAFNGAEPIRAATLDAFARAFAGCGFRRRSWYPCYGLAEATLLVAGDGHRSRHLSLRRGDGHVDSVFCIERTPGALMFASATKRIGE
jgi:acyl-CoA synthetase (AMP-forming)/AMP-acid ligase II